MRMRLRCCVTAWCSSTDTCLRQATKILAACFAVRSAAAACRLGILAKAALHASKRHKLASLMGQQCAKWLAVVYIGAACRRLDFSSTMQVAQLSQTRWTPRSLAPTALMGPATLPPPVQATWQSAWSRQQDIL
jgi:hypothetical protein